MSFATNPDVSKWIKNISEGEGATVIGYDDYGPEMAISGKVIHLLWTTNNNWVTKDMYYRRSADGGTTWETRKLLVSNAGLDDAVRSQKMYVSGNYVHISYNKWNYGKSQKESGGWVPSTSSGGASPDSHRRANFAADGRAWWGAAVWRLYSGAGLCYNLGMTRARSMVTTLLPARQAGSIPSRAL